MGLEVTSIIFVCNKHNDILRVDRLLCEFQGSSYGGNGGVIYSGEQVNESVGVFSVRKGNTHQGKPFPGVGEFLKVSANILAIPTLDTLQLLSQVYCNHK